MTLSVNSTATLTAAVSPANATNKAIIWTSDNESVATVSNGRVIARAAGTATITVTAEDSRFGKITASCQVRVTVPVANVSLNAPSAALYAGSTAMLTAAGSPANATNKAVIWTSDNESVATVSNGTVTARPQARQQLQLPRQTGIKRLHVR